MIIINPREAVFEEFWNPTISALDQYTVSDRQGRGFQAEQLWSWVACTWRRAEPGNLGYLGRSVELDLTDFDEIIVAASLPSDVSLTVTLSDAGTNRRVELGYGSNDIDEHRGDIRSIGRVSTLSFEFSTTSPESGVLCLLWLGFSRSQPSDVHADTPNCTDAGKYLAKYIRPAEEIKEVRPTREYVFTQSDVERIRAGANDPALVPLAEVQRRAAAQYMTVDPAASLGRHVWLSGRSPDFARVRDRDAVDLRKACQTLAFVALVDNRTDMAVKACEFALVLASCSVWRESFITDYPFSSWAHAAFTEALCTEAVALTVDWAGEALNPAGERFLAESVYDKGLWRIERQFMRRFYRVTNPGLVFFPALIMGGLLVSESFVYYTPRVRGHFRLFKRIFHTTLLRDNGTNRPPLYWNKLLGPSLVAHRISEAYSQKAAERYVDIIIRNVHELFGIRSEWLERLVRALSRKFGPPVVKLALFPGRRRVLKRCDDFARAFKALLSDSVESPEFLPIGDRTTSSVLPDAVLLLSRSRHARNAAYWRWLSGKYVRDHAALLNKSPLATGMALSAFPENRIIPHAATEHAVKDTLTHLKHSGFFTARRRFADMDTLFAVLGLPKESAHRHSDIGSVVLQVNRQDVFLDRGSLNYGNPLASQLKEAQYHNVLTPCLGNETVTWPTHQHAPRSGVQLRVKYRAHRFVCQGEFGMLWPDHLVSHQRRIESHTPELVTLNDQVQCLTSCRVTVHLHTPLDCAVTGNQAIVTGKGFEVRITAESGVDHVQSFLDLVDERERKINHLCFTTPQSSEHDLKLTVRTRPR